MPTLNATKTTTVPVTKPVARLVATLENAGWTISVHGPYRGSVEIAFDNRQPTDNGAVFGAITVGTKTGRFIRANIVGFKEADLGRNFHNFHETCRVLKQYLAP